MFELLETNSKVGKIRGLAWILTITCLLLVSPARGQQSGAKVTKEHMQASLDLALMYLQSDLKNPVVQERLQVRPEDARLGDCSRSWASKVLGQPHAMSRLVQRGVVISFKTKEGLESFAASSALLGNQRPIIAGTGPLVWVPICGTGTIAQ
jgi:hypothetical protein